MKVLIVSDTHGHTFHFSRVLSKIGPIDALIHLGDFEYQEDEIQILADCPTYMVRGNNDFFSKQAWERVIEIEGHRIFMCHGHKYRVGYTLEPLIEAAKQNNASIAMFGHTHLPLIKRIDGIYCINPGSISLPRQDGRIPTYIIMEIDRFGEVHFTLNYAS